MRKIIMFLILVSTAQAQTPTPTPVPTPIKGFIDPCKLPTKGPSHAAWKAANCR